MGLRLLRPERRARSGLGEWGGPPEAGCLLGMKTACAPRSGRSQGMSAGARACSNRLWLRHPAPIRRLPGNPSAAWQRGRQLPETTSRPCSGAGWGESPVSSPSRTLGPRPLPGGSARCFSPRLSARSSLNLHHSGGLNPSRLAGVHVLHPKTIPPREALR